MITKKEKDQHTNLPQKKNPSENNKTTRYVQRYNVVIYC